MLHFNTSAKDSLNVEKAFEGIGRASVSNKTEAMYSFSKVALFQSKFPTNSKTPKRRTLVRRAAVPDIGIRIILP
jgi:hypothetical protein